MSNNVLTSATNASSPQQELDALLAMVSNLAQMSLDMTRLCIDVQSVVPGIALSKRALEMTSVCLDIKGESHYIDQIRHSFALVAEAAVAAAAPPAPLFDWVRAEALTPDQLEASYAKGVCDNVAWQVVCIGREPGIDDAKANVEGVPSGFRKKKDSRLEALAFYRSRYEDGKVQKWRAVPIAPASAPAPANDTSAELDPTSEAHAAALTQASDNETELVSGWVSGESVARLFADHLANLACDSSKSSVRIKQ
ncbi:hypothetical protein C8R43DRAFT_955556 [Mycena crocata]|nr:hypothetical protein C8R43DRAFT_955556 [Mycena crocata]